MTRKNLKINLTALLVLLLWACGETTRDDTPWVALFDGETLDGWIQKGGEARYEVREETIVGTTVHHTPNSFLTTDSIYDHFNF